MSPHEPFGLCKHSFIVKQSCVGFRVRLRVSWVITRQPSWADEQQDTEWIEYPGQEAGGQILRVPFTGVDLCLGHFCV